jgi:hypothetical protein
MNATKRVGAVDFWRGIVLVSILCDHIPGNLLEHVTHRNFGFSDGAEVFVFLSGVAVGLVYYKRVLESKFWEVMRKCVVRATQIYATHVVITIVAVVIFALAYNYSSLPGLIENDGRLFVFHKPLRGFFGVLLMSQQLGYLNILPLYVVLMLWAPVALLLARRSLVLVLAVSLAIYGAARLGLALPCWPEPGTWFLNPFAWQLVFTIGMIVGIKWARTGIAYSSPAFAASIVLVLFGAVVVSDGFGLSPGLRDSVYARFDLLKQNLGVFRLLHFLALAYIVSQLPVSGVISHTLLGQEVQRMGRHSLAIFALGTLLSCGGQALIKLVDAQITDGVEIVGLVYTLFSVVGLILLARYLEWAKPGVIRQSRTAGDSSDGLLSDSLRSSPALAPPARARPH